MCGRFTLTDPRALPAAFPRFRSPSSARPGCRVIISRRRRWCWASATTAATWSRSMRWGFAAGSTFAPSRLRRAAAQFGGAASSSRTASTNGRDRRPYYYTLQSGEPFAFAGLWEPSDGTPACDIVTCEPNALVAPVHDRMPVILAGSAVDLWLDPEPLPPDVAASVLRPFDAARWRA